jgi:hypothetical protein
VLVFFFGAMMPDRSAEGDVPQWWIYTRLSQYGYNESNWVREKGFATFEEAEAYLDGPSHPWPENAKRCDNSWLGPIKAQALSGRGQFFAGPWLRDALKMSESDETETFEQVFDQEWEASATDTIPHVMDQMESEGLLPKVEDPGGPAVLSKEQYKQVQLRADKYKLPEIECWLDASWNFFEIEVNARRQLGHMNPDENAGYERRLLALPLTLKTC